MEIFTHDLHKYVRHSYRCRSSIDYEYMLYVHVYGGGKTTSNLQGSHRLQESIIRVCVFIDLSKNLSSTVYVYIYIYINRYISISGICVFISIHTKI